MCFVNVRLDMVVCIDAYMPDVFRQYLTKNFKGANYIRCVTYKYLGGFVAAAELIHVGFVRWQSEPSKVD